jgi:hypothetical protein
MKETFGLKEVKIPKDSKEGQASIFVSADYWTNPNLLVLIQGTGAVRAGFWARSVVINDSLEMGSMLPQLEFAKTRGCSVIVMNPNENKDETTGQRVDEEVLGMGRHADYVWAHFVKGSMAKRILMIAHSAGGGCARSIIEKNHEDVLNRVKSIAFTDASHGNFDEKYKGRSLAWVQNTCVSYVASNQSLGTILESNLNKFPTLSAGH